MRVRQLGHLGGTGQPGLGANLAQLGGLQHLQQHDPAQRLLRGQVRGPGAGRAGQALAYTVATAEPPPGQTLRLGL